MFCPKCGTQIPVNSSTCTLCGTPFVSEVTASETTSLGLPQNVVAVLCYVLGWITGLVFLFAEKENKFVRFHAMQSVFTFGGLTWLFIIAFSVSILLIEVPDIGPIVWLFWVVGWLWFLLIVILWIVLMVKAYQGERFKLLCIGKYAEKFL